MTASSVNYTAERAFREHLRHSMRELKRDQDARSGILELLGQSSPQRSCDLQGATGLNVLDFADVVRELVDEGIVVLESPDLIGLRSEPTLTATATATVGAPVPIS